MGMNHISPDQIVFWQWDGLNLLNLTIVYTWVVMALIVGFSWLGTRRLRITPRVSRWQNFLEILVDGINRQIRDATQQDPQIYLPFIGTLFIFIAVMNLLSVVPGFYAPTGSLSTTTALALCVFFAVPVFGIARCGLVPYLRQYVEPSVFMLPFNIIGELSRTLALAVRLFGNMMSGTKVVAILVSVVPFFVSIPIMALGLLTGLIQAYIFAMLALVYIASATQAHEARRRPLDSPSTGGNTAHG